MKNTGKISKRFKKKDRFFNRELAWLAFNEQVLAEALDPEVPLLERLRFIGIVCNNLDEFFMVRVAELKRKAAAGEGGGCPTGMSPGEQIEAVSRRSHELVVNTYGCALGDVFPALARQGIRLRSWTELSTAQRDHFAGYFDREVLPVLTPMAIDASHPFPLLQNQRIYLGVILEKGTADAPAPFAVVQIPSSLPRIIKLPAIESHEYLPIEELVRHRVERLFCGHPVRECFVFRVTRDSELDFDGDAPSFLSEVEAQLRKRRTNNVVRLEVEDSIDPDFIRWLAGRLRLTDRDIYLIPGPLDLNGFSFLADVPGFDPLHYEPLPPQTPPEFEQAEDPWSVVRQGDILLHHPFDSFDPVVSLLKAAANDPSVLAIKQTLYRTSRDSRIIQALTEAAQNGKQVSVVVELMARFDEERNVQRSKRLEEAGAHVIWGIQDYKVHSKILLIVRREPQGLQRYVHLGTGNYNERTVRQYEDLGLLTCHPELGEDASNFFNSLTGYSDVPSYNHFLMAPHGLRDRLLAMVKRETKFARLGGPAAITAKMNSLVDRELIDALYEASDAGVKIRLNVRGICCLKPGVPDLSDNIQVVSVIDRYLEHARIYCFHNGGHEEIYLSSADWMPRNLDRRIELMFPVLDEQLKERIRHILDVYFRDNRSARVLMPDGTYVRRQPAPDEGVLRTQYKLHRDTLEENQRRAKRPPMQFVPKVRSET